jgi:CheY-like chemotaxis protein
MVMNKTIIFIDDEPDILKVTTFRLKKMGYNIITAANGKDGLELIRTENTDLVFLDLLMPVMDGYEICKLIKRDESLKDIPVVLFTAVEDKRVANALKETGADGILAKPYETDELLKIVHRFVGEAG